MIRWPADPAVACDRLADPASVGDRSKKLAIGPARPGGGPVGKMGWATADRSVGISSHSKKIIWQ